MPIDLLVVKPIIQNKMNNLETIFYLQEINSTNTYIKELYFDRRLPEGFTVYTGFQTAGRGQKGNTWESEPQKNLLFSTILYPHKITPEKQFLISEVVSLSIKDVLSNYTSDITIKWPNDIYWNSQKIAGILIENAITDSTIDYSIIGVGLNLNQDVFLSDAPNPVSLSQITGQRYNLKTILTEIQDRLLYCYKAYNDDDLHMLYNQSLFRKNECHWYSDGDKEFRGTIQDVKQDGRLIVALTNNTIRSFFFKEIKFLLDR